MNLLSRIARKVRRHAYEPSIKIAPARHVVELGTEYGGWNFIENDSLNGATIISAGLGEDASFDVLFAARYRARVIIVDPTPRAVAHFRQIQSRIGRPAETSFVDGGQQPAKAYDLTTLSPDQLVLIEKALWIRNEPVRFFQPANPAHVSHSIANLFNNQTPDAPYLEVPSTTLPDIVAQFGLSKVAILKIDIEGVEVAVLDDMLQKNIHPDQILVEFDEIATPSSKVKSKYQDCDRMLRNAGYLCVFRKGGVNFTYAKADLVRGV
jgi:FkbM family methyltransferase